MRNPWLGSDLRFPRLGAMRGKRAPVNLITNGDFSDGLTGWSDISSAGGSVAVVDGAAVIENVSGVARLQQNVSWVDGVEYTLTWTQTGGVLSLYATPTTFIGSFGAGSNSLTITAAPDYVLLAFRNFTAGTEATIDDVVLIAVG